MPASPLLRGLALIPALLLLAALPSPVSAQVGQVNGLVLDTDRDPVAGAAVALIPEASGTLHGASTDPGGRYAFRGLPADQYSVVVLSPRGASRRKDGIRVRALFRSIVDFNLGDPESAPASIPRPGATLPAAETPVFAFSCALNNPSRAPVPDATVILMPAGGEGVMRLIRSAADGKGTLPDVTAGTYRIIVRAPGFMSWSVGPVDLKGLPEVTLSLTLEPFPMGFPGSLEDLLIPPEPIPPAVP